MDISKAKSVLGGRKFRQGANTGAAILIFLVIVVLVSLISQRHYKRFDLTLNKKYTLSEQSKKILKSLQENLNIYAFYKGSSPRKKAVTDLLEQYKAGSRRVKCQFIDPDLEPGRARKYQVTSYDTLVLEYGSSFEKVTVPEEKELTTALLKLTRAGKKTIYFSKGHGEKALEDSGQESLGYLKKNLEDEQYLTKEILLLQETIPSDCNILVICGPKVDFVEGETKELDRFISGGGRILVFLEPGRFANLQAFLGRYGLTAGNDTVVDLASRRIFGDAMSPMIIDYPDHQITRNFNVAVILTWARSVEPAATPPTSVTSQSIAKTTQASWAETDTRGLESGFVGFDEKRDRKGPISVAAVSEIRLEAGTGEEVKKGRIAAVGDADFVTNKLFNIQGNRDFVLNTIAWLAEEEILISIRSKDQASQPLNLSARQGRLIFYIPVVLIPLAVLFLGGFVCLRRKLKY